MMQIFISYSRDDSEFVNRLQDSLTQLGYSYWIDVKNIRGGNTWRREIQNGLYDCKVMLIIISPTSMESDNVLEEFGIFHESGKPIIPVLYKPAKKIYGLNSRQHIDFHNQTHALAITQLSNELSQKGIFPNKISSETIKIDRNKTGNLFWLCHDLLELHRWLISNIPKEWIDVGLRQSCHHANQLNLSRDSSERLENLRDKSSHIHENSWTEQNRLEFANEVKLVFNIIAQEVQGADPNFDSGPG